MILQFGAGNFLRAFVDLFVSQTGFDRIVVVQSTGIERAEALNRAGGKYHVAIQGFADGRVIELTPGTLFHAPKGVQHGPHVARTEVISLTVFDGPLTIA